METLGVVLEPSALKWNSSKQIYKLDIRIINTSPKPRVISIQKPIDSENYDLETTNLQPVKIASGMDVKASLVLHTSFFDPSAPHNYVNVNVDGLAYPVRLSDHVEEAYLQLTTPHVDFDEILLNGKDPSYREITIVNNGDTAGSFEIFDNTQNLDQALNHGTITNIFNGEDQTIDDRSNIQVEDFVQEAAQQCAEQPFVSFSPSKGCILPLHSAVITVTIKPKRLGTMHFDVPIQLEQGSNTIVQNLKVTGEIIGNIIQLLNPSNLFPISFINIPPTYYNTQTIVKKTLVNRTNDDVSFSFEISKNPIENIWNKSNGNNSKIEIKSSSSKKLKSTSKPSVCVKNSLERVGEKKQRSFENYLFEAKNSGSMVIDDNLLMIEPMQGVLDAKASLEVTFKFAPRWNASSQGFKCIRLRPPTKELEFHFKCTACRMQGNNDRSKKVLFNSHKSETDLALRIEAISTAADVRFTPSEDFLDLGPCIVGSQTTTTLYVYNASVFLPVVFSFAPLAHYRITPSEGLIAPRQQSAVEVMFSPKQAGGFDPWLVMEVYGSKHVEGHSENFKVFYKKRIKLKGYGMYGALKKNTSIIGSDIESITDKRLIMKKSFKSFNMSDLEQLTMSMRNISQKSAVHQKVDDFDVFIYTPDRDKVKEEKIVDFEYASNDVACMKSQTIMPNNNLFTLNNSKNENVSTNNSNNETVNRTSSKQNNIRSKIIDKKISINVSNFNSQSTNPVLKINNKIDANTSSSYAYPQKMKSQNCKISTESEVVNDKPIERIKKNNVFHNNINNNCLVKDSIIDMKKSIKRAKEERANLLEGSESICQSDNNNANKAIKKKVNQALAFLSQAAEEHLSMKSSTNKEKSMKNLISDLTKPITNVQLNKIKIEPSTLEYGRICVNHPATKDLSVINNFSRPIHFALKISDAEINCIKAAVIVEPFSMETLPITILPSDVGRFIKHVSFTLNGYFESNVTLMADIEHASLSFSCSEIVLDQSNSLPGDHFIRGTFSIINNLGTSIPFFWRSSNVFPDPNHLKVNDEDVQLIEDMGNAFHELDHLAWYSNTNRRDSFKLSGSILQLRRGSNRINELILRKVEGKIVERMALMSSAFKVDFLEKLIFSPFFIFPERGEVAAYSSVMCQAVCYPNYNTLLSHNMVMYYASGYSKVLKINLFYSSSRVYLKDSAVFLYNSPIGLCSTNEVLLYNDGEHCSFFKLSESNPIPGLFVHPSIGKVMPGGSTRLLIIFTPEMFMDFDISVFIEIVNGRCLELRIVGSVSKPWIEVDRDELDFGTVFLNSTTTLPLVIQNKADVKSVIEFDLSKYPDFSIASNTPSLSNEKISKSSQYCLEANSTLNCWLVFKPEQVTIHNFKIEVHINKYSSIYDTILGFKENPGESYENNNLGNEKSSKTDFDKLKNIKSSSHYPFIPNSSADQDVSDLFINVSHVCTINVKARVSLDPIKIRVMKWLAENHSAAEHVSEKSHNQNYPNRLTSDSSDTSQSNNNAEDSTLTPKTMTTDMITNIDDYNDCDIFMQQIKNSNIFNEGTKENNMESNVVSNIPRENVSFNNNNKTNIKNIKDGQDVNPKKKNYKNNMELLRKPDHANTNKNNSETRSVFSDENSVLEDEEQGEVLINYNVFVPNPSYSMPYVLSKVMHLRNTNMHSTYDLSIDLNDPLFLSKVLEVNDAYIIQKTVDKDKNNLTLKNIKADIPIQNNRDLKDDDNECFIDQSPNFPTCFPITNFKPMKEIKKITNMNNNYNNEIALSDKDGPEFDQAQESLETENFESNNKKKDKNDESKSFSDENNKNNKKNRYLEESYDLASDNNDEENGESYNTDSTHNNSIILDDENVNGNNEISTDELINDVSQEKQLLNMNNNRKIHREHLGRKVSFRSEGKEIKHSIKNDSRYKIPSSIKETYLNKMETDSVETRLFRKKSDIKSKKSSGSDLFETMKQEMMNDLEGFTVDNDTLFRKYSIKVLKHNALVTENEFKEYSKQHISLSKDLKLKFSLKAGDEAYIVIKFYAGEFIRLLNILNDEKTKETVVSNQRNDEVLSGFDRAPNRLRSTMEAKGVIRLRFPYDKKKVHNYRILRFQLEIIRPMIFFDPPHLLIPPLDLSTDYVFNINLTFCNYDEDTRIEVNSVPISSGNYFENIISLNFLGHKSSSIIKKPTSSTMVLKVTLRSSQAVAINSRISVLDSYGNEFEFSVKTTFDNTCFSNLQIKSTNTLPPREDDDDDQIPQRIQTPFSTLPNNMGTPIIPRTNYPKSQDITDPLNSSISTQQNDFDTFNNESEKIPDNNILKTVFNKEMETLMVNSNQNNNLKCDEDNLNKENKSSYDNNEKMENLDLKENSENNVQKNEKKKKIKQAKIVRLFRIINENTIKNHGSKKNMAFKINPESLTNVINSKINRANYIKNLNKAEETSNSRKNIKFKNDIMIKNEPEKTIEDNNSNKNYYTNNKNTYEPAKNIEETNNNYEKNNTNNNNLYSYKYNNNPYNNNTTYNNNNTYNNNKNNNTYNNKKNNNTNKSNTNNNHNIYNTYNNNNNPYNYQNTYDSNNPYNYHNTYRDSTLGSSSSTTISDTQFLGLLENLQLMFFGSFWCPVKHDNMQHYHFNQSIKALEKWFSYQAWPKKAPLLTSYYPIQIPFTARRNYDGRQYKSNNQNKKHSQSDNRSKALKDTEMNNNNIELNKKPVSTIKFNKNIENFEATKSQNTSLETSTQSRGALNFSFEFLKNSLLNMPHNAAINASISLPQRRTIDEMLTNLFERQNSLLKKHPSVLPCDLHERLKSIYKRYAFLIDAVKACGGCLEHISPEYLFNYRDYYEWRLLEQQQEEYTLKTTLLNFVREKTFTSNKSNTELHDVIGSCFGCDVLDPSNNQFDSYLAVSKKFLKLELALYEIFSKRAWADFLMQVYKVLVFGHNRKTTLHQYKFPIFLNAQREKCCKENVVKNREKGRKQNRNLSNDETALMVWVNIVLNLFRKHFIIHQNEGTELEIPHRQISNFGKDFQDGLVLLFLLLTYIPHLSKSLMSRIILDPKKRAQKYHNILLFCTTLKSLKIFYDIQPHQILSCHVVSVIMLCFELFKNLPEYLSKSTINFPYNLHAPVQRELQLYNPSKCKINYRVMLIGLDFNKYTIYEKGIEKTFDKNKKTEKKYLTNILIPNEDDINWKGFQADKKEMVVRKGQKNIDVLKKHTLKMQPHKLTQVVNQQTFSEKPPTFMSYIKKDQSLLNVLKTTKSHIEGNWMEVVSKGVKNLRLSKSVKYKPDVKQNDTNNNDKKDNGDKNNVNNNGKDGYIENNGENNDDIRLFSTACEVEFGDLNYKKKISNKNEDGEIGLTKIKRETDSQFSMAVFDNEKINDFINFNFQKSQKKCDFSKNSENYIKINENKMKEQEFNLNNHKENVQANEERDLTENNNNNKHVVQKFENLKTKLNKPTRKLNETTRIDAINNYRMPNKAWHSPKNYFDYDLNTSPQIINFFPLDLTIEANSSMTLVINHLSHNTSFESSLLVFYATYHHSKSKGENDNQFKSDFQNDTKKLNDDKKNSKNIVEKLGTNFVFLLQPSLNSIYYQDTFVFEAFCYEPKIVSIKVKNIFSLKSTFNVHVYKGIFSEKELLDLPPSLKESVNLFAKNQKITLDENESTDLSLLFISLTVRSSTHEQDLSSLIFKSKKDFKNEYSRGRFEKENNLADPSEAIKNFKDKHDYRFDNNRINSCHENCFINTILLVSTNGRKEELFYVLKVYVLPPKPMSLLATRDTVSNMPETIGFWRCPTGLPIEKSVEIPVLNHARQAAIVLLGKLLLPPEEASMTSESAFLQQKIVNFVTDQSQKKIYRDIFYNVTFSSSHFSSHPYVEIPTIFNQLQRYINLKVSESMAAVEIRFKFESKDIGLYKSLITLKNDSDHSDIRVYKIMMEAFDDKGELIVNMFCQVNKSIHQTIPLHNFSPLDWKLNFHWRGHTCFSGKSESFIPAYHTLHYPILFKPMLEGSFDCILLITNDYDDYPMVIKLYGTGIKRTHEDEFVFRGMVGESQNFVINVPNRTHHRLNYWVKSNLYVVTGQSTVQCPPLECVEYHCLITPMRSGEETGIIAFEATASQFPFEDDDIQMEHSLYPPHQRNQPDLECAAKLKHILKRSRLNSYLNYSLLYQNATESNSKQPNDNENNQETLTSMPTNGFQNVDGYHTVEPKKQANVADVMGTKLTGSEITNFQVPALNETPKARFVMTSDENKTPVTVSNFKDNVEIVAEKIKTSIYKNNESFHSEEETETLKMTGESNRLSTNSSDKRDFTSATLDSKTKNIFDQVSKDNNDITKHDTNNQKDLANHFSSANTNMSSFSQSAYTTRRTKLRKLPALNRKEASYKHPQPTTKSSHGTLTVWFKLKVIAEPGPPLKTLNINANALKKNLISLTIPNNANQAIDVKVDIEGENLIGEPTLHIPKMSCAYYQCCFIPHTAGQSTGRITMYNKRIGEFWFQLNFTTEGIVKGDLNAGGCFIGQELIKTVALDNPSFHRLLLVPFSNLLPNFRWNLEAAFWLESQSSTTIEYCFMPDMIKDYNGIIGFHTDIAGDWIFEVDGFGIDPAKEWKETIKFKTEPFSSAKQMLTIFNSSPVTVNATVSLEASPKNADDGQNKLRVFSFADEYLKGSSTYKTRVPSMQNLIIKIEFQPEDKATYNASCRIYLEKEDKSSWSVDKNLTMLQLAFALSGNPMVEVESEPFKTQHSYNTIRNDNENNNVINFGLNKNELESQSDKNDIENLNSLNTNQNSNTSFSKKKVSQKSPSLDYQSILYKPQPLLFPERHQSLPQTLKPLQKTKTLDLEKRFNDLMNINKRVNTSVKYKKPQLKTILIETNHKEAVQQLVSVVCDSLHFLYKPSISNYTYKLLHYGGTLTPLIELQSAQWLDIHLVDVHVKSREVEIVFNVVFKPAGPFKKNVILSVEDTKLGKFYHQNLCFYST